MPLTHLQKKYHISFIAFLLFSFWIGLWAILIIFLLIYAGLIYLFRRDSKDFLESHDISQGVVLSPVNGKVLSVRKGVAHRLYGENLTEIQISIPWWVEWSVRLPVTGDIVDYDIGKRNSLFRFLQLDQAQNADDRGITYTLMGPTGSRIGLQFIPCPLGLDPQLIISPGDRGMRVASIGYFPLGGTVIVYLQGDSEVLVNINDTLVAGESPLAGEPSL
jgi:hypothetical protein